MGHHFGVPFHRELQRHVVLAALSLLNTADEPGTILDLLMKWTDVRREAKALTEQLLHRGDRRGTTSRRIRETEAEATAFVVCHAVGLETGSAASDYIQL